jgi:hypothetical protein
MVKRAIDLVGAGHEDGRTVGRLASGFQDIERPNCIRLEVCDRIPDSADNRDLSRQMEDDIGIAHQPLNRGKTSYITFEKLKRDVRPARGPENREVALGARSHEGIENHHIVAIRQQTQCQVRADKARASSDERDHDRATGISIPLASDAGHSLSRAMPFSALSLRSAGGIIACKQATWQLRDLFCGCHA